MTDRIERLTNLLALLLETRQPLSLVQIADQLDGQYPTKPNARRATFERDKATLRSIGVPISQEIVSGDEHAGQTRYWIDRSTYEMGDIGLEVDEMRALQVALAATRPGSPIGQDALWKLGGEAGGVRAAIAATVPDVDALPTLREAIVGHRPVAFDYRSVERIVDPWGLLLTDGFWYLAGFDRTRQAPRTYRVDRIEGEVAVLDGPAEPRPDGFDLRQALPSDPKLIGVSDPSEVAQVWVSASRAPLVVAEVGDDRVIEKRDDGSVVVEVVCANRPAFRSWVLGYVDQAEVLSPPAVRDEMIAWLEAVAS